MNRSCGIEIKSNSAILIILEGTKEEYKILDISPLKIELEDCTSQENIIEFSKKINGFFKKYEVNNVIIKEGLSKGKFSSGAAVFKIETIIQMSNIKVELVKAQTINSFFKKNEIDLELINLKKYQRIAFQLAYYSL